MGVYNWYWTQRYKTFRDNLRKLGGFTVNAKKAKNKWHAKIYILKSEDTPILGIIGSSNITNPAFGAKPPTFNGECDVVIWDSDWIPDIAIDRIVSSSNESNNWVDIIRAEYDPALNDDHSIPERLRALEKQVLDQAQRDL